MLRRMAQFDRQKSDFCAKENPQRGCRQVILLEDEGVESLRMAEETGKDILLEEEYTLQQ